MCIYVWTRTSSCVTARGVPYTPQASVFASVFTSAVKDKKIILPKKKEISKKNSGGVPPYVRVLPPPPGLGTGQVPPSPLSPRLDTGQVPPPLSPTGLGTRQVPPSHPLYLTLYQTTLYLTIPSTPPPLLTDKLETLPSLTLRVWAVMNAKASFAAVWKKTCSSFYSLKSVVAVSLCPSYGKLHKLILRHLIPPSRRFVR